MSALPTVRQVKISLRSVLRPPGEAAKIATLLKKGGYSFSFTALMAGHLRISWYLVAKRAAKTKGPLRPIIVATGQLAFHNARTTKITVKLTARGKTLLEHVRIIMLTAEGSFAPIGRPSVIQTRAFTVSV